MDLCQYLKDYSYKTCRKTCRKTVYNAKMQLHVFLLYCSMLLLKFDINNALLSTAAPHPFLWQRLLKVLNSEAALKL